MSCKQLGGACDTVFSARTFEELAEMSKKHGMEMVQKGDQAHIQAMQNMKELMKSAEGMKAWFEGKRNEFNSLSGDAAKP